MNKQSWSRGRRRHEGLTVEKSLLVQSLRDDVSETAEDRPVPVAVIAGHRGPDGHRRGAKKPLFLHKADLPIPAAWGSDKVSPDKDKPGAAARDGANSASGAREADAVLMARIASGDASAFEEVVGTRLERVLAVSRRMLGEEAEAEDVAQEALLRLWRQAANWDGGRALISTWLYRVAVNLCVDRLRARKEKTTGELPEIAASADQERGLEEEALKDFVDKGLQSLPERQRTAIVLFHHEELSMTEVAEMMETSVEAVESLLARGRRALKQLLEPGWKMHLPERRD